MNVVVSFIDFLQANEIWAYFILFIGSYLETLIGTGFFIYGEIFFLAGAILAGAGVLNIWLVAIACILGGILGDTSSYIIGRKFGHLIVKRFFKKENRYLNPTNYKKGTDFIHKHGLKGIYFSRLLGPISWVTPFIAGTLNIKYKNFLKYNIPGVITGIGIFLVVGYFFGFSYNLFLPAIEKNVLYIVLGFLIIGTFVVLQKLGLFARLFRWISKIELASIWKNRI